MTRRTTIVLASVTAAALMAGGFAAGRWLFGGLDEQKVELTNPPVAQSLPPEQAVSATTARLGANAEAEYVTYYSLCGHKVINRQIAGPNLVGKTRAEIAAMYPDASITSFSNSLVVIETSVELHCPQHYILRKNDKGLGVYRTDENTMTVKEIASFSMEIETQPTEVQQMLADGMVFESLGEIEAYLEDLDS